MEGNRALRHGVAGGSYAFLVLFLISLRDTSLCVVQALVSDRKLNGLSCGYGRFRVLCQEAVQHESWSATSQVRREKQGNSNPKATVKSDHKVHSGVPWKAGYYKSLRSQKRIKNAARSSARKPGIQRGIHVLETLLSLPPERCNSANLVCALTLSAKIVSGKSSEHFRSLLFRIMRVLLHLLADNQLSPRQLCNAAWAIAKHADRDDQIIVPDSTKAAVSTVDTVGHAERWDMRKVNAFKRQKLIDDVVNGIAVQLTDMLEHDSRVAKEGELCMACWAFAVIRKRQRIPGMLRGVVGADTGSDDLSNFVTFEQGEGVDRLKELSEASNITSALFDSIAKSLCEPISLTSAKAGSPHLRLCKWNELSNVAWAFARCEQGNCPDEILLKIANEATRRLSDHESPKALSRNLAQIIWALGTQPENARLADGLIGLVHSVSHLNVNTTAGVAGPIDKWSCADLVQVAVALAHARLDHLTLLNQVYEEAFARLKTGIVAKQDAAIPRRKTFEAWELTILLWVQARLFLKSAQGRVFEDFASRVAECIVAAIDSGLTLKTLGIGEQEGANTAWSLTVLEVYHSKVAKSLLKTIFAELSESFKESGVMHYEHAHQLWQALFILGGECAEVVCDVPRWFHDFLEEKWQDEKARSKSSSARHKALSDMLHSMGVSHLNEHDEDIDVAIVLKPQASWTHETGSLSDVDPDSVKVAVEIDGPFHFTRQLAEEPSFPDPPRALGHTVIKYRMLKRQGWTVIRVPYFEFDKIPVWASMERQRYVQRLLKTHSKLRFSDADYSEYKAQVANRRSRYD